MKKYITLLLLIFSLNVYSQTKKPAATVEYTYLTDFKIYLEREGLMSSVRSLIKQFGDKKASSVVSLIDDSLKHAEPSKINTLIRDNQAALSKYYDGITSFGETPGELVVDKNTLPFYFVKKENQLAFMQVGVFSTYSLNTLKLDADERARHVAKNILLPSLKNFIPLLKTEIRYFIMTAGYKVKDFSNHDDLGDGELTAILIDRQTLQKYSDADITDGEVFKSATFYNYNKNGGGLRKIDIQ